MSVRTQSGDYFSRRLVYSLPSFAFEWSLGYLDGSVAWSVFGPGLQAGIVGSDESQTAYKRLYPFFLLLSIVALARFVLRVILVQIPILTILREQSLSSVEAFWTVRLETFLVRKILRLPWTIGKIVLLLMFLVEGRKLVEPEQLALWRFGIYCYLAGPVLLGLWWALVYGCKLAFLVGMRWYPFQTLYLRLLFLRWILCVREKLSKQQISQVAPEKLRGTGEGAFEDKCVVCFEQMSSESRVRRLPCKHEFHVECIDSWLEVKQDCPVCRRDL